MGFCAFARCPCCHTCGHSDGCGVSCRFRPIGALRPNLRRRAFLVVLSVALGRQSPFRGIPLQ